MSEPSPYDRALAILERRGRAPWQRRLEEFMAPGRRMSRLEISPGFGRTAEKLADALPGLAGTAVSSWAIPGTDLMSLARSSVADVFEPDVRHLMALDFDGTVAGVFAGGDVYVDPSWRGRGLGAELMLARAVLDDGGVRSGLLYSPAGHAAAVAAHRLSVVRALEAGREVRPEVVADHPSLGRGARPPGP